MVAFVYLVPLILFSVIGFWKANSIAFLLAGSTSVVMGFSIQPTDDLTLSAGLLLFGYGIVCICLAFGCMFNKSEESK